MADCYQTIPRAGSWLMWPNEVWYPPEGAADVRFDMETDSEGWGRLRSLSGLVTDEHGRIYGIRRLLSPRESGYQMEGRVSIGGKKYRAFTSSTMFELPDDPRPKGRSGDGRLVDVATLSVVGFKAKTCLPPYANWEWEDPDEAAAKLDEIASRASLGKWAPDELFRQYHKSVYDKQGKLADDLLKAISSRQIGVESRIKGAEAHAMRMDEDSEESLSKYKKAYASRPKYVQTSRVRNLARRVANP